MMSFKEVIDKLSISSKEAVIDGNKSHTDLLKDYLHVERHVEQNLKDMVLRASEKKSSKLILVSGNVGDGKSHLLSRLFKLYPEQMAFFQVKNDATESRDVNRSWKEELSEFLEGFKDESLLSSSTGVTKAILAINLGTLTNFLSEQGGDFTELQKFVDEYDLLKNSYQRKDILSESHFDYINLADYQLFSLTENDIHSKVISSFLEKITNPTEDNPFYSSFIESYKDHPSKEVCPIYYNYNFISDPSHQDLLKKVILQAIVRDKLIISVRQLLHFIYQLVVPSDLQSKSAEQVQKVIAKYNVQQYINSLIPYRIFDTQDELIFKSIKIFDPCMLRDQKLDLHIFRLIDKDQVAQVFEEEKLELPSTIHSHLKSSEELDEKLTKTIIRFFTRLSYFKNKKIDSNIIFNDYIQLLYFSHVSPTHDIALQALNKILMGIYNWNGSSSECEYINIDIGKKQNTYMVSQYLAIYPEMVQQGELEDDNELHKFNPSLKVAFKTNRNKEFKTVIDYNLFELLYKVSDGYRPNREDRQKHLGFEHFIKHLTRDAGRMQHLSFQQINGKKKDRFILSYAASFKFSKK